MYIFKNVYRKVSDRSEELRYEKINEDVEMGDMLVDSLVRSSAATIKHKEDYMELYYNM